MFTAISDMSNSKCFELDKTKRQLPWEDKNCNWSLFAIHLNPEFGVNHYFQHHLDLRKFASESQPWLLSLKHNDKIPQRGNYEFLLNHIRLKKAWQCFILILIYSTYLCSIPSQWQICISSSWGNTLTYKFLLKFRHCWK